MQLKSMFLLAVAFAASGQVLKVNPLPNPSGAESLQAHWGTTSDGSPLLSWVEKSKDGYPCVSRFDAAANGLSHA
jgi:hypothetical protein